MAGDPRFKCQVNAAQQQSSLRAFGQAVGKVGDLAVLNSVGGGQVGAGLRNLASVSNSIRSGCGALPTAIGSTLESGANWVLESVGITPSSLTAVQNFNPQVANVAQAQAQQIFQKVKSGHFKPSDIPSSLQDLQNLERLARNIYTPESGATQISTIPCQTSPYAIELIQLAPKHKFMFVVEIQFNDGFQGMQRESNVMALAVKKSTRPATKFIMEDVNYYNFRTKVVTKTEVEDMRMTFHDDTRDASLDFYKNYRKIMSPIANMTQYDLSALFKEKGMDFANAVLSDPGTDIQVSENETIPVSVYTASRGPLVNDNINPIKYIRLYHVFDAGTHVNVYTFLNPRITSLELDDVDMAVGNEGTEVSIAFNYDSVHLYTDSMSNLVDSTGVFHGQEHTTYPLRYNPDPAATTAAHIPQINAIPAQPNLCAPPGNTNTSTR